MTVIKEHIKYLGVIDEALPLFEGQYPLTRGVSYNSYMIDGGDKIAVLDTVEQHRGGDWLQRLNEALDGRKPDYLIIHHLEPDHSAMVGEVLKLYPDVRLVLSRRAWGMLPQFIDAPLPNDPMIVADGDGLSLGRVELKFATAAMVHWPEVMVTYDATDHILFSADAFGAFAAADPWDDEARRYYCNIVGKYGAQVQAFLTKSKAWQLDAICPLHGPVLSSNLDHYLGLYDLWSRYEPETRGVLVAHASIYGHTAEAARRMAHILRQTGAGQVTVIDLARTDGSYALAEAFRLSGMVLACSTYDGGLFPPMEGFLRRLVAKGMRNRRVGLIENGSWAPVAGRLMTDALSRLKGMEIVSPTVTLRTRLETDNVPQMVEMAKAFSTEQ